MTIWRHIRSIVAIALMAAVPSVRAHDLPVNQMVNAMVRVDGSQADLIARVPTDLLRGVPFPQREGRYDIASIGPTQELVNLLLADAFTLAEHDARLTPNRVESRLVADSDRSFDAYDHADSALHSPPDIHAQIAVDTGYLVIHLTYPITSDRSRFEIQSQVALDIGTLAPLTVRFERADGSTSAMIIPGGSPPVDLDPAWYRAAGGFIVLGIEHILSGTDHLLFLLCLVIPVRRLRDIVPVVTAFTLAHSMTLIASAMGVAPRGAWFPPLVEAAIAASIVYTAAENIFVRSVDRRWLISCLFGLIHGFGFSNALGDSLQFAGEHLILALLAFNVGIEAGQLGVLCIGLPVLALLRHWIGTRRVVVMLSLFGGAMGALWLVERWQVLREFDKTCSGVFCIDRAMSWVLVLVCATVSMYFLARGRATREVP